MPEIIKCKVKNEEEAIKKFREYELSLDSIECEVEEYESLKADLKIIREFKDN